MVLGPASALGRARDRVAADLVLADGYALSRGRLPGSGRSTAGRSLEA